MDPPHIQLGRTWSPSAGQGVGSSVPEKAADLLRIQMRFH